MAVGTRRPHHGLAGKGRVDVVTAVEKTGMKGLGVAALAKKRLSHRQHPVLSGAVGIMTGSAVLADRLMFPEKRPAFFGMAGRAGLIDGAAGQHPGGRRAVGVMAIIAGHQAFSYRVVAAPIKLRSLFEMTGKTNRLVTQLIQHGGLAGMHGVAGDTSQVRGLVFTGRPVHGFP